MYATPKEFNQAAAGLLALMVDADGASDWVLECPLPPLGPKYLVLRRVMRVPDSILPVVDHVQCLIHVVLHPTYTLPAIYFRMSTLAGSPLSLEDSARILSAWSQESEGTVSHDMLLSTLSFGEHPVLATPFLYLHPCMTSELLESILPEADQRPFTTKTLLAWLGIAGQMFGGLVSALLSSH
ncbi:hypothetical protein BC828DRAFT_418494, partial [Blastocladiella britannica]